MTSTCVRAALIASTASTIAMTPAVVFAQAEQEQSNAAIEEILVTATRRSQSVQDVPYNISAISGDDLDKSSLVNGNDLLRQVPGVFVSDMGGRSYLNNNISIRGINANNPGENNTLQNLTDPSVSTYIGDTPVFLNVKLTDVKRVELLRGPQGTLYGSGSVGGTVRYIFNEPDLEESSFDLSVSTSMTDDADDLNYSGDFVANVPLSDNFAIRVVGGAEELAGFIDNRGLYARDSENGPATPSGDFVTSGPIILPLQEDTDGGDSWYLRTALLGELSDNTRILATYLHQEDTFDGHTGRWIEDVETSSGPSNVNEMRSHSTGEITTDLAALEITTDFGFATLTSSTAFTRSESDQQLDVTDLYEALDIWSGLYFGFPRILGTSSIPSTDDVFTQEIRLVSTTDSSVDWLVGGFYKNQDRDVRFSDTLPGYNDWLIAAGFPEFTPVDPVYNDIPFDFVRAVEFEEIAVFGELTFHVSDRWQITTGARVFWQDFSQDSVLRFPYCSFFCAEDGEDLLGSSFLENDADFQDNIVKLNTSYDISENQMIYATFSQGFRHGGANAFPTTGPFAVDPELQVYKPDELDNFEIGIKGGSSDNRFTYTVAMFRSDWENLQLDTFLGLLASPGVVNGGDARSEGVEISLHGQVSDNFAVDFGYSYTKAELSEDAAFDAIPVFKGDRIPGNSENTFSLSADYTAPLSGGNQLVFHIDASYRSDFQTMYNSLHDNFAELDGYEVINLAVNWQSEDWSVGLFGNNLTNVEGANATQSGRISEAPWSGLAWIMRPRTIGLTVSKDF